MMSKFLNNLVVVGVSLGCVEGLTLKEAGDAMFTPAGKADVVDVMNRVAVK